MPTANDRYCGSEYLSNTADRRGFLAVQRGFVTNSRAKLLDLNAEYKGLTSQCDYFGCFRRHATPLAVAV